MALQSLLGLVRSRFKRYGLPADDGCRPMFSGVGIEAFSEQSLEGRAKFFLAH
jgi:hypothetical protein